MALVATYSLLTDAQEGTVPGDLVVRAATADDIEQIVALNVAAFGVQDGPDVRAFLGDDGTRDAWSVVAEGTRVASSIGRIDHRMQVDGLEFTAAQIEYVATDPAYQRRGLVASQLAWHHQRCDEDGIPLQLIGGIPYFYRRFGYGYGLEAPTLFLFDPDRVAAHRTPGTLRVRAACASDVAEVTALEQQRPTSGLRVVRDEPTWRRDIAMCEASEWGHLLLVENDDAVLGWVRLLDLPKEKRTFLFPSVARTPEAVTELVWETLRRSGDHLVVGFDSPASVFGKQLRALGDSFEYGLGYYARIPDPLRFLELLRPVLSARLAASDLADSSGTLEISLYSRGLAIDYDRGTIGEIRSIPGVEDPIDDNGIGVAPDWFPALVLGRWGATELARRIDDVIVARDRRLMDALFPRQMSDVAADF